LIKWRHKGEENLLGVGPENPTMLPPGKKVSVAVTVALGGGKRAVDVDPAKEDAGSERALAIMNKRALRVTKYWGACIEGILWLSV
jgi:hypothetical protein